MDANLSAFGRVVVGLYVGLLVGCGGGGYGGGGGNSPPPASVSLSVDPMTITLGQSATVTWSSNGTTCTATGAWSGTKPPNGMETVTPTATGTFTYRLTCSGGAYGNSQELVATLMVNPVSGFTSTPLVSRFAGTGALMTDTQLTNPRGIAFAPNAPVRVLNSRMSTAYDGHGKTKLPARALASRVSGGAFEPTGIAVNDTLDFVIAANGNAVPARFIYAGKGGMIGAWSPALEADNSSTMYVANDGAVYMGVAVASAGGANFIFATDFHNSKIDVFDASFARQTSSPARFRFSDPTLPAGYAPFGIQAIRNRNGGTELFVTYAKQLSPDNQGHAIGQGLGIVNVFDTKGALLRHLVPAGGALNAPWGIARAPTDFGTFSNALLVGNSGDGKINAYDPASGAFIGTLSDSDGKAIVTRGLWGIAFGNDSNDQPHNALFFAASTDELDGTYGRIDLDAAPLMLQADH